MCLEENTRILMADGSQKPVREIRIGDMVMCDLGEPKIVRNVWQGREDVYRIKKWLKNYTYR